MSEITTNDCRRIAAEAVCDPRTVKSFILGDPVRPLLRERIVKAMLALGYQPPAGAAASLAVHRREPWC